MSENTLLYEDDDVTLRQYQTGRFGLTVHGLRILFTYSATPTANNQHTFYDAGGAIVGYIPRACVPNEVTLQLDEIEAPPSHR